MAHQPKEYLDRAATARRRSIQKEFCGANLTEV